MSNPAVVENLTRLGGKACNQVDYVSNRHCQETEYVRYRGGSFFTMIGGGEKLVWSVYFMCKGVDLDFLDQFYEIELISVIDVCLCPYLTLINRF